MHLPDRRVALAFLAHPDDAEFLCAGTLIRLTEMGWQIHVATATPGDCGTTKLSREAISEIRRKEGAVAAELIGAQYHCLEEGDLQVVFDRPTIQKAIDLFRKLAPALVFTHPRHDYMLDHEQVHLLARAATFAYPIPNASKLPLLPGSAVPWLYYCDPPEQKDPYTGVRVQPSCWVNISSVIEPKTAMLACHASQREWLQSHHQMDEYLDSMRRHSQIRGQELGVPFAEAFVQHRGHAYPEADLLTNLLGG